MKTKLLIILSAILLAGCGHEGISTNISDKNGIKIELLFENDGCKVYRFYDQGKYYYSDCSSKINNTQQTLNN